MGTPVRKGRWGRAGKGLPDDDSSHHDTSPHSHTANDGAGAGREEGEEVEGAEDTGGSLIVKGRRQIRRECRLHCRERRVEEGTEGREGAEDEARGLWAGGEGRGAGGAADCAAAGAWLRWSTGMLVSRECSRCRSICRRRMSQSSECRSTRRERSRRSSTPPHRPTSAPSSPEPNPSPSFASSEPSDALRRPTARGWW